jgi:hypothetical protein
MGSFLMSELDMRFWRRIVAKVIQFYIPEKFKLSVRWSAQAETGKVLQFPSEVMKKSA